MDKNAIKKYAVWARRELIERVSQRALRFGITADGKADPTADSVNGYLLSSTEKKQREALIKKVEEHGYEQVVEEVAYTWFNRFAALRFMEVNGYLPSHVRVFTNDAGEFKPQILAEAIHLELDGLNMDKVYELKDANDTEELYRYLLIVQCNALNAILPGMFQRIADYTELLLPENLLREGSVIHRMVTDISEEDFNDTKDKDESRIEIIGWLYQYYISEKHEEVVNVIGKKVVEKENVAAATQLFTTDWVVRYLIDNSVGRYWIERNPNSTLADKLTYFVKPKDGVIKTVDEKITPQELTVFDPCVGSGHFLVYAFEVLMKIYSEYGYNDKDAVVEIVQNNLYGLDIDGRAVQLAYFAVMMKARRYDRRFLTRHIQPHVYEIIESNGTDASSIEYFCDGDTILRKDIKSILDTFVDAKEYGSILQVPEVDFKKINERISQLAEDVSLYNTYLLGDFKNLMRVAEVMSGKYAVLATNPPYLNKFDVKLKKFIVDNYNDYKGDLFSVFIYRNFGFSKKNGYSCLMTPMVWMFIQTYEKLRKYIIDNKDITTLIQFEYSAYEEATVPICTFVLKNYSSGNKGSYLRLVDYRGGMEVQRNKAIEAISTHDSKIYYEADVKNFYDIPTAPIAYWASNVVRNAFKYSSLYERSVSPSQNVTGNNGKYVRKHWELEQMKIGGNDSWIFYCKGGGYRKWWGNLDDVVNWTPEARHIYQFGDGLHASQIINKDYWYKKGITWGLITSSVPSFRIMPYGATFDKGGSTVIVDNDVYNFTLGLLNSKVYISIVSMLNPTLNYQVKDVRSMPLILKDTDNINRIVNDVVAISKLNWDSFETSWEFSCHPIVAEAIKRKHGDKDNNLTIEYEYNFLVQEFEKRFIKLKAEEEELNHIFIDIYGLKEELTPEIEDKDVTVARIYDTKEEVPDSMKGNSFFLTKEDVMKSFISYAVGCMFGRYSLDVEGLAYAGGEWDANKYKTFLPDIDAIIPICDDEYFEDDIVGRFVQFVEVVYGKDTLEENLQFIADALGGKGTAREVIRNYFVSSFYADHVKTYKKCPIYWLFDSGKKNGFKCLIYMHRYQPDTLARIRTDYIHEQQSRYRTVIDSLEQQIASAGSSSERVKLTKLLNTRQAQAKEIREYEEKVHHLADQMIEIDLDDGVKHNYAIFKDVLAKIK